MALKAEGFLRQRCHPAPSILGILASQYIAIDMKTQRSSAISIKSSILKVSELPFI